MPSAFEMTMVAIAKAMNGSNNTGHKDEFHHLHEDDFAPYIGIIAFSIITMICNFVVFFIIARSKELRKRPSNKFLLNLMVSDLCVGIVMLCFSVSVIALNFEEHEIQDHKPAPTSISLMLGVLILLSVTNMILLSGDRLFAIKWTYRYVKIVTSRPVHVTITVPWILSVVYFVVLVTLIETGEGDTLDTAAHIIYISFDVIAVLGFIILSSSSVVIYKEALSQLKHIRTNSVVPPARSNQLVKTFTLKERRLALINIGVVVKFFILWLPCFVVMTYHLVWETYLPPYLDYIALHLILVNCTCDPTLYVLLSRDIRILLIRTLRKARTAAPLGNDNVRPGGNSGLFVISI